MTPQDEQKKLPEAAAPEPAPPADPLDQLLGYQASLQDAIGRGLRRVATPQLGDIEFPNTDQLLQALGYINGQIAALTAPGANRRVLTVVAYRGLWPQGIEGAAGPCGCRWGW